MFCQSEQERFVLVFHQTRERGQNKLNVLMNEWMNVWCDNKGLSISMKVVHPIPFLFHAIRFCWWISTTPPTNRRPTRVVESSTYFKYCRGRCFFSLLFSFSFFLFLKATCGAILQHGQLQFHLFTRHCQEKFNNYDGWRIEEGQWRTVKWHPCNGPSWRRQRRRGGSK